MKVDDGANAKPEDVDEMKVDDGANVKPADAKLEAIDGVEACERNEEEGVEEEEKIIDT